MDEHKREQHADFGRGWGKLRDGAVVSEVAAERPIGRARSTYMHTEEDGYEPSERAEGVNQVERMNQHLRSGRRE
jgi:hypothetical protein